MYKPALKQAVAVQAAPQAFAQNVGGQTAPAAGTSADSYVSKPLVQPPLTSETHYHK